MKRKNYRLFLLGFVAVSFVFLTGLQEADVNDDPLPEKHAASDGVKISQDNSKESPNKSKLKKTINKPSIPSANEDAVLQKTLDLTIPFKASENAWSTNEQSKAAPGKSLAMFASGKKKRPRSIDLNGQMLMSQEPEVDKQKSVDGAGIVFTLKR